MTKMRLSSRARALVKRCEDLADSPTTMASFASRRCAARNLRPSGWRRCCRWGVKPENARELAGGSDLDDWLRDSFFEEHCKLFHHRPFVWHIWDGRKRRLPCSGQLSQAGEGDGKGRSCWRTLTYAYLGDWITRQKDGVKRGEGGAEARLAAARGTPEAAGSDPRRRAALRPLRPLEAAARSSPSAGSRTSTTACG